MPEHDVRDYWSGVGDQIAERPDLDPAAGDASPYIKHQSRMVTQRLLPLMPVPGRSVLEVGCGPGGKLQDVSARGPERLVGADLSPVMVRIASERLAGKRVELVQLDGGQYPFEDREFDLVYTCTVLHHNPDSALPGIVAEIARVSAEDVFLIEATAIRPRSASDAFHLRRVDDYARLFAGEGFGLVAENPLGTYASEVMASFATRVAHSGKLGQAPYREGAPVAPLRRRIEAVALPATRVLDRVLPQRWGLTGLAFRRETVSTRSASPSAG